MSEQYSNEPMLDMFLFETTQLIEQLEQIILASEKGSCFSADAINEIFRIMHTIKGSAAMMMFTSVSVLAHSMEDVFYYLREENPEIIDCSKLSDLVLEGVDCLKEDVDKIKRGEDISANPEELIDRIKAFLTILKTENNSSTLKKESSAAEPLQYYIRQDKNIVAVYRNMYRAIVYFEEGCEMENIRAYTIIHNLEDITTEFYFLPEDIIDSDDAAPAIRKEGFKIYLKSDEPYDKIHEFFMQTIFLKDLELTQLEKEEEWNEAYEKKQSAEGLLNNIQSSPIKMPQVSSKSGEDNEKEKQASGSKSLISVSIPKLDKLMDLVGEMVIAESMVIQNPDLQGLEIDNFYKAARQLNKITSEIQDIVMSIRMVPLSATFIKMHRVVRDMCKNLGKEVELDIIGEETEVDKNIIEHISDPLMHLVRNAVDHGIEPMKDRASLHKPPKGTITIEAKNAGSDVLIIIKDDGKGLDKEKILAKARKSDLLYKREEDMSDKEIYNLILLPGFSTKEDVSEYSGRGVGMDVVSKNIESIGGIVSVESTAGKGTTITLKIPLTLAIIDGMNIKVGDACYTLPTIAIKESFRPREEDLITDPNNNEMIMVRGNCYPILRLHAIHRIRSSVTDFTEGIFIMIEQEEGGICLFVDELLGQQQVVVKTLPEYIQNFKKIKGLSGCTLLGNGRISLILDVTQLIAM
ncbi:chemotaxis protein CheA [Konateibacter massiliensis]|uniref:chemotaxis protein CheA n=1 Tax=Konateibacter massiliensis TaxID=2002841 RepID=UPI000C15A7B7|nr:chemotaxis protein CheA [Konateibacter massiliensis]